MAAFRCGSEDFARRQVVRDAHEGCHEVVSVYIVIFSNFIVEEVCEVSCERVDIVDVVAVLRACECKLSEVLIAFPVIVDRIDDVCQSALLFLEDELLNDCERVGCYREADTCEYRTDVVLGSAVDEVLSVLHAVLVAR